MFISLKCTYYGWKLYRISTKKNWFGDKNFYVYVDICILLWMVRKDINNKYYKINNKWLYHFIDMHEIITKKYFLCMACSVFITHTLMGSNFSRTRLFILFCVKFIYRWTTTKTNLVKNEIKWREKLVYWCKPKHKNETQLLSIDVIRAFF